MKKNQIYVCGCEGDQKCDCMIEVLRDCETCADTAPICCGQPMKLLEPKTADQGREKHVPVIEKQDGGYLVKVGDVPHPMIQTSGFLMTPIKNLRSQIRSKKTERRSKATTKNKTINPW